MIWPGGTRYEGRWDGDLPNGEGIFALPRGEVYEGQFEDGKMHGSRIWGQNMSFEATRLFGSRGQDMVSAHPISIERTSSHFFLGPGNTLDTIWKKNRIWGSTSSFPSHI